MQPLRAWDLEEEILPEPEIPFEFSLDAPPLLPKRPYYRSFLLSVVFHCALIFGLPPLFDLLPESDAEAFQRQMLAMRPLEIRVPDRLYLSPTAPNEEVRPPVPPKPNPAPKPTELAKEQIPAPPKPVEQARRTPPKLFQPPVAIRRTNEDLTLIQSHLPPDMALAAQVKLPQLALLSGPMLPRPAPRRFVEPGKSSEPAVAPRLDAPPPLASPGEANPDLQISSMLAGPDRALLRLPRPNVPVRKFQAPAPLPSGRGASVSPTLGEPVNILALSSDPAPLGERVTIPLGNQIGRLPELPKFPDAGSGRATQKGSAAGTGGNSPAGAVGGTARQAEVDAFLKALASLPDRFATPIKIEHPANAVFDVVVVQSSAEQAFPDSAGALSGKPVYTVYLQVGSPKPWILQYCIPRQVESAPQIVGGAVNIGAPTSTLKAPFPLVTVLPPAAMLPRTGYIIVHASVTAKGELVDLDMMRAPNPRLKDAILPELLKWQFRPAIRDGAPVAVEVLLAIPPQDV